MQQKQRKKRTALLTGLLTLCTLWTGWGQIISQYVETNSGSTPKGIEIWNNTGATLDFSTNNLEIQQGTNGGTPTTLVTVSSGTLASGEVMVIGTSDMGTYLTNQSLTSVTFVNYGFTFNGNDALVVEYGGVVTDVFGNPGSDPGSEWSGNGVSTKDQNIQLLGGITTGDTDGWTDPSLRFETVSTTPSEDLTGFGIPPTPATAPLLTATPTTLTNFEYIEGNGPSASQSLDVSGINLDPAAGTINVAAPANFEVSLDDNTFADDVDIAYTAGEFTDKTVYVRLKSGLTENTYNGDITISGGDAADITVAVDGEVTPIPQPELLANPTSLSGLNYMDGNGPSAAQLFELSGVALDNSNVTLTAPTDFEISEDDNTYSNSITLSAYDGTPTNIYVRLQSGLAEAAYNGDITISGGGITGNITVALSGEVTPFIDQYAGVGVFELVTSLAELEDGYYVVANEASAFLMTNGRSGSATTGHFVSDDLILDANDNVVNPATDRVWYIEANGTGYTIYNDDIEKYVGWVSGNAASIEDNVSDISRWTFSYQDDKFTVNNVATPVRQLSYNSGAPRFAAYGNTGQHELQLYKYTIPTDPILTAAPLEITGLNYTEGEGPSAAQPLEVSAINMDGTDVTVSVPAAGAIELAATESGTYSDEFVLPAFDGDAVNVFVRLKAGLTIGDYSEVITISGGGATDITVNSSGQVAPEFDGMETFENFPETASTYYSGDFIGVYGNTWNYIEARGDYQIDGETVMLRNQGGDTVEASLNSSIGGGIAAFSFDYMQAFSTNVNLEVHINGNLEATVTSSGEEGVVKNSGIILLGTPVQGVFTIEFKQGSGGGQVAIDNFNWTGVTPTANYTWEDGAWSPQTPIGNATATDDILIVNGTAVFNGDIEMNNLYVQNGATLQVENILKVNGDIENNGAIVFVSSSVANTAQFDTFTGTINGNGTVTAERFIPARRAFRLLSAPVTSTGSINANWQEGANNIGTNFPADNQNPNPGYGTHITGSTNGANGFDATPSGNPSLFYLDVANQSWEPFANTDNTTIQAGVPHRLMVRGGRDINVTSNSATPSDTRLRTTGSLYTGPQTQSYTVTAADDLVLFGNPYQASVDMDNVLTNATNINPNFYYIWDPTLGGSPTPGQPGGRGAYVTVDTDDWSNEEDSDIGQYLQPHQAALVRADAPGTVEINFAETDKAVGNLVTVFSAPENTAAISLKLYEANAYDQNNTVSDALKIKFAAEGNNAIDAYDAIKIGNLDENLATENDGNYLSVESRAWPTEDDIIPLFINQHRHQDYVFVAHTQGLEEVDAYLRDHYLMEELLLDSDSDTTYTFSVSEDDPSSMATDRFELYFVDTTMGINDMLEGQVVLYPNPSERAFYLQSAALSGKELTVSISNMLGQKVYEQKAQFEDSGRVKITPKKLLAGVYLVTLQDEQNNSHTIQWIKK